MRIIVDGKDAVLKKNFTFDFVSENRMFLGRDGYTLNISFPMAGCPENTRIFGHINRLDVAKGSVSFECSIIDKDVALHGSLCIVKISDTELEGQFAEGRCEQTASDPFEETYISELDLGSQPSSALFTPYQAWRGIDDGCDEVALPWVNEESPDQFNNWITYEDGKYKWQKSKVAYINRRPSTAPAEELEGYSLSWQPYLIRMAQRICSAVGYAYDFNEWESSDYKYLIICNSLPYSWDEGDLRDYKRVLPKWTVSEFFEKLELLLAGEFDFNHKAKLISFRFTRSVLAETPQVLLDDIVDNHSSEISKDSQSCDYLGAKRLKYKECSHSLQPFYACDWFVQSYNLVKEYEDVESLVEANKLHMLVASDGKKYKAYGDGAYLWETSMSSSVVTVFNATNHLMYAKRDNTYFVFRSIGVDEKAEGRYPGGAQVYVLQPVNVFGSGVPESEDVDDEEIEFVPVCINDTRISEDDDKGYMMFLSFSSYQEDMTDTAATEAGQILQPLPTSSIMDGKKDGKSEYYDSIYVAFWDGSLPTDGKSPCPAIDMVAVTQDWECRRHTYACLRLTDDSRDLRKILPAIIPSQKLKCSWLGNVIPDPRAVFHIRGKRYVCEKITATFTENGMSQLLKGEFYPMPEG